jgi:hypothetical protein
LVPRGPPAGAATKGRERSVADPAQARRMAPALDETTESGSERRIVPAADESARRGSFRDLRAPSQSARGARRRCLQCDSSAGNADDQREEHKESTMYAPSRTVRLVSAALALSIGVTLVLGKVHFSDEYTRQAAHGEVIVLPVAEVIGERPASLAATPGDSRAN